MLFATPPFLTRMAFRRGNTLRFNVSPAYMDLNCFPKIRWTIDCRYVSISKFRVLGGGKKIYRSLCQRKNRWTLAQSCKPKGQAQFQRLRNDARFFTRRSKGVRFSDSVAPKWGTDTPHYSDSQQSAR